MLFKDLQPCTVCEPAGPRSRSQQTQVCHSELDQLYLCAPEGAPHLCNTSGGSDTPSGRRHQLSTKAMTAQQHVLSQQQPLGDTVHAKVTSLWLKSVSAYRLGRPGKYLFPWQYVSID